MKSHKHIKKSVTLLLILAMTLSLTLVGSAHWANHTSRPTQTYNTEICQIDNVAQTVTFTQTSAWANALAGKAEVELSFDGAQYVMKELKGYDFAILMDTSGSPNATALKNSAIAFVDNVHKQNPDARFTVIWDNVNLPSLDGYTTDRTSIVNWLSRSDYIGTSNDMVQPACHKAYDMHQETGRDNPLMIIVVGDGDFNYRPDTWKDGFSFEAEYKGDQYKVSMSGSPNTTSWKGSMTYGGYTYWDGGTTGGETWNSTRMTYTILKDDMAFSMGSNVLNACFAQILYLHKFRNELWPETKIATICTPSLRTNSYAAAINEAGVRIKGRWAADEGYNFELKANTNQAYIDAFAELETSIYTRVVTLNTTIDNRYFTVDEAALESTLPEDCTYKITNTIRDGVAVQDVQIIYELMGPAALSVNVSIPVTIHSDIPREAFDSDKFLPVIYDGTAPDGAAGCLFVDLNGVQQEVHTRKVYIDATPFAPTDYRIIFNANFPSGTTNTQPNNSSIDVPPGATLIASYEGVFGSGTAPATDGKIYTFLGWYTLAAGGQRAYTADKDEQMLYAQWEETLVTYTVTFDANGGSGAPSPATKTHGVALTLPDTKPTRSEYVFRGWAETQGATTAQYKAGGSYTSNGDVTLYAVWTRVNDFYAAKTGNVILRGDWSSESSGYVTFWVSCEGAPIEQTELDEIEIVCSPALHWAEKLTVIHATGKATLTGTTDGNFAEVRVPVDVRGSGVSAVTMEVSDVTLATAYVITPGDVVAYGLLNASDVGYMSRVVNKVDGFTTPGKGLENNFAFEMMDMTKDGSIVNASDVGALSRIVNGIAIIY